MLPITNSILWQAGTPIAHWCGKPGVPMIRLLTALSVVCGASSAQVQAQTQLDLGALRSELKGLCQAGKLLSMDDLLTVLAKKNLTLDDGMGMGAPQDTQVIRQGSTLTKVGFGDYMDVRNNDYIAKVGIVAVVMDRHYSLTSFNGTTVDERVITVRQFSLNTRKDEDKNVICNIGIVTTKNQDADKLKQKLRFVQAAEGLISSLPVEQKTKLKNLLPSRVASVKIDSFLYGDIKAQQLARFDYNRLYQNAQQALAVVAKTPQIKSTVMNGFGPLYSQGTQEIPGLAQIGIPDSKVDYIFSLTENYPSSYDELSDEQIN
jgi:hypothetical protein